MEDRAQGAVLDARDIADRIVRIAQVLHEVRMPKDARRGSLFTLHAHRFELDEAKGGRIVLITRARPICVGDHGALAVCVVVDEVHKPGPAPLAVGSGTAQVHLHPLQQVRVVERRAVDAAVRRRDGNRAVEGVESTLGVEPLRFEFDGPRPIRWRGEVPGESATTGQ